MLLLVRYECRRRYVIRASFIFTIGGGYVGWDGCNEVACRRCV